MIRKEKKYTACPKCLGNMRVRKDGSYKCRLCKSTFTREEYVEKVSSMLLNDIQMYNQIAESKMKWLTLKKWIEDQGKSYE